MDKTLKLWVGVEADIAALTDGSAAGQGRYRRAALQEFESRGFARRRLDAKGRTVWQATARMHRYLRDAQLANDE
jgi:hypothetical protein